MSYKRWICPKNIKIPCFLACICPNKRFNHHSVKIITLYWMPSESFASKTFLPFTFSSNRRLAQTTNWQRKNANHFSLKGFYEQDLATLETKTPSSVLSCGFPGLLLAPPTMLTPSFSPAFFFITSSCET